MDRDNAFLLALLILKKRLGKKKQLFIQTSRKQVLVKILWREIGKENIMFFGEGNDVI